MIDRVKSWLAALTLATVVVAFVYFAAATAQQNQYLASQAEASTRTERALCILRADLEQRVKSTQQFLEDHPDGIPGISAATLQQSIENQQRTVTALQLLECEDST